MAVRTKRRVSVIGIGAGNPDHLTVQAVAAMNRAQVFFVPGKGAEKESLAATRRAICDRFVENRTHRMVDFAMPVRRAAGASYDAAVSDWHAEMAAIYGRVLTQGLGEDERGAFLVWGDPTLYDSTIRILDRLNADGFDIEYEVIPGITAVQALAAAHRVPLNAVGRDIAITTGRRLADGVPAEADSVVVMLDSGVGLRSVGEDMDVWWGANIGLPDETLVAGRLQDVRSEIEHQRSRTRERQGWVMDTYLLRRRRAD